MLPVHIQELFQVLNMNDIFNRDPHFLEKLFGEQQFVPVVEVILKSK